MDAVILLAFLLITMLFSVVLTFGGWLGGYVGGKMSSWVLKELNPGLALEAHKKIIKRSTLGFLLGTFVGSIPIGVGLAVAWFEIPPDLSSSDLQLIPVYIAVGFVLMGAIGATIAGSALFDEGIIEPIEEQEDKGAE